ncbi:asparagine synthase (glutamine-hydrolyzing) [Synechococcus sp. CBW1002]|uniref:asparagine synthase (glutamine-hydrolyzing) n=1 Tax=Synechococcus sp. CBW1002 TaxID=1353134 RepID=UPI0018CCBB5E|nr:asparagine synthase (glutamine-hydrolyzing) [Synechococcus sp. CBW1002]QPN59122.1 asparagine synthase (glutamine-hydrolyzing) [Synechococcus sp. CBW1002]
MCGLIGEVRWSAPAQPLPLTPIRHRGPDAEGSWLSHDGYCWLGHTRLAIQDLSEAGAQPITSHCGRFTLVYNGEIYNHQEVRCGLRFQAWRGHSDSETLVEGLAQRGLALVLELRGMFAFAAYDRDKQQLLLGRDRLGIKPLYLCWIDGGLRFASERRALPGGERLSGQDVSQILAFGHLQTPAVFQGPDRDAISSLPAGTVVRINSSRPHDPVRYWPPQPRPEWTPLPIRNGAWARRFLRQQLEATVQQHLLADVPVACFLSSGLDSGILTALACTLQPGRIASFTVAFPGNSIDEGRLARQMARHCGSDHHELQLDHDQTLAWVEAGLQALDVPSADGLNTYLISRAVAEQGIKVALSGLGADELFGGYPSHRFVPWLLPLRWLPAGLRGTLLQTLSPRLAAKLHHLPHWDRWHLGLALRRWASNADLAAAGASPFHWPEEPSHNITQGWGQISWAELFGYTEPMLLRDSDAMSMASGLELRVPFLDHRIVEIALRMPQRYQSRGKGLLRAACLDLFPVAYLDRPKQGFTLPMRSWMLGPLRALCRDRLVALQASGCLEPGWTARQWQAFEEGQVHWSRIWSLVVLGEFQRRTYVYSQ